MGVTATPRPVACDLCPETSLGAAEADDVELEVGPVDVEIEHAGPVLVLCGDLIGDGQGLAFTDESASFGELSGLDSIAVVDSRGGRTVRNDAEVVLLHFEGRDNEAAGQGGFGNGGETGFS